jgi:hypothetical protein
VPVLVVIIIIEVQVCLLAVMRLVVFDHVVSISEAESSVAAPFILWFLLISNSEEDTRCVPVMDPGLVISSSVRTCCIFLY